MKTSAARAITVIAALAMAFLGCQDLKPIKGKGRRGQARSSAGASSSSGYSGPKAKLEFYVMSKCPFGTQVEKGIKPVIDEIGDYIDFHLEFIANEAGGKFTALHG